MDPFKQEVECHSAAQRVANFAYDKYNRVQITTCIDFLSIFRRAELSTIA
jgi:hypothetical protein